MPEDVAITLLGHPTGAGEMAVMDAPSPLGLGICIDAEQDLGDLFQGCAGFVSIEEPHVELDVIAIIAGDGRIIRRRIGYGGLDSGHAVS